MTGITLLKCQPGKSAAKRYTTDGREDFDAGWLFEHKWFDLDGFEKLTRILRKMADDQDKLAIRGRVKDGAPKLIRRSKKDATHKYGAKHGAAWVEAIDQQWLCIDLDGVPDTGDPRDHLPEPFKAAACLVQYSSSHGTKGDGLLYAHVWFWCDRAVCDASLRSYAETYNHDTGEDVIDVALFDAVQAHYISNPVFEGTEDPVPQRFVELDGTPHVTLPDCVVSQVVYEREEAKRQAERDKAIEAARERTKKIRERFEAAGVDTQERVDAWLEADINAKLGEMAAAAEGNRHETIIKTAFYVGAQSRGDAGWKARGESDAVATGSTGASRTWNEHFDLGAREGTQFVPNFHALIDTSDIDDAVFEWDEPAQEQSKTLEERIEETEHCEWLLADHFMDVLASLEQSNPVDFARIKRKAKGKVNYNDLRAALKRARVRRKDKVSELEPDVDGVVFTRGDHTEVAEYLLDRHEVRPVFDLGALHVFEDGTWTAKKPEDVRTSVGDLAQSGAFVEAGEKVKAFTANRDAQRGISETMFDRTFSPDFFAGKRAIAFTNGTAVVDEEEGKVILVDHEPALGARWGFDFDLDRTAVSPRLQAFFESTWADCPDRDERVMLMQEFLGCMLFGVGSREQKALLLLGPAGTGKSTVLNVCRSVLPSEAVTAIPPHHWGDDNKIAQLARARANLVYETPRDYLSNVERIKEVIDGAPITTREAYGRAFTFAPDCVHLFAANRLPEASGGPDFFDRFIMLDLTRRFRGTDDEERDMAQQIAAERAGIIAWCVGGVERFLAQDGYTMPESSEKLLATWESEIDSVNQWVTEVCGMDIPTFELPAIRYLGLRDTYGVYREWCAKVGRQPVGEKEFSSRCEARGMEKRNTANGYKLPILSRDDESIPF